MITIWPTLWRDDYPGMLETPNLYVRYPSKIGTRIGESHYFMWQRVRKWWWMIYVKVGQPFFDSDRLFKRAG